MTVSYWPPTGGSWDGGLVTGATEFASTVQFDSTVTYTGTQYFANYVEFGGAVQIDDTLTMQDAPIYVTDGFLSQTEINTNYVSTTVGSYDGYPSYIYNNQSAGGVGSIDVTGYYWAAMGDGDVMCMTQGIDNSRCMSIDYGPNMDDPTQDALLLTANRGLGNYGIILYGDGTFSMSLSTTLSVYLSSDNAGNVTCGNGLTINGVTIAYSNLVVYGTSFFFGDIIASGNAWICGGAQGSARLTIDQYSALVTDGESTFNGPTLVSTGLGLTTNVGGTGDGTLPMVVAYDQGQWTPTVTQVLGTPVMALDVTYAAWQRVGNNVSVAIRMDITQDTLSSPEAQTYNITMPFANALDGSGYYCAGTCAMISGSSSASIGSGCVIGLESNSIIVAALTVDGSGSCIFTANATYQVL